MATTQVTAERKGFSFRIRYIVALLILVPVLAHLLFAVTRSTFMNYYVTVDELVTKGATTGRVRVGGPVVPGSINWNGATRLLTFEVQGDTRNLTVSYRGFAPDSFRDGATVIVEGELDKSGTFAGYDLLIKCPHQYVPAL